MSNDLLYTEIASQPYDNCRFSAGFVGGHPHDTVYLRFERDGEEPTTIHMRPDEMAAVGHVCAGTMWSLLLDLMDNTYTRDGNTYCKVCGTSLGFMEAENAKQA